MSITMHDIGKFLIRVLSMSIFFIPFALGMVYMFYWVLTSVMALITFGLFKAELSQMELLQVALKIAIIFGLCMALGVTLMLKIQQYILSKNIQLEYKPSEKLVFSTVISIRKNLFKQLVGVLFLTDERLVFKPRKLFFNRPDNIEIDLQDIHNVSKFLFLYFLPDGIRIITTQKKYLFRFPEKQEEWITYLQKNLKEYKN